MATIRKAAELIEAFPEYANFAGGVPFEEVWVAEQQLAVTFPDSYRDYLQRYGAGSFGGLVIFGLGVPPNSEPNVVYATELMRKADDFFPGDLVPVMDTGEGDILCLAISRLNEENECPVVQWIPEMSFEEQMFEVINTTFAHLLLRIARQVTGTRPGE